MEALRWDCVGLVVHRELGSCEWKTALGTVAGIRDVLVEGYCPRLRRLCLPRITEELRYSHEETLDK